MKIQQLIGVERDEVVALVDRLQQAGRRASPQDVVGGGVSEHDIQWASDMQLPSEFFDYFVLERAA